MPFTDYSPRVSPPPRKGSQLLLCLSHLSHDCVFGAETQDIWSDEEERLLRCRRSGSRTAPRLRGELGYCPAGSRTNWAPSHGQQGLLGLNWSKDMPALPPLFCSLGCPRSSKGSAQPRVPPLHLVVSSSTFPLTKAPQPRLPEKLHRERVQDTLGLM